MIGKIYINGEIGNTPSGVGVCLVDVMSQVKAQPEATSFDVIIDSVGGCVEQGWKIADYLKGLNVPTNAIGSNIVASISTVIFGSCTTRQMTPNTQFMIHLPWGVIDGTADELKAFSELVKIEENKLIKFYSELMGFDKEVIKSLITKDVYLNEEQLSAFNITTKQTAQVVAKAYFNLNTNNQMNNLTKEDKSWIERQFLKIVNLGQIKNKVVQDANGVSIDFEDVSEDATPMIDDKATIEGEAANGSFLMPEGETFVFVDGVLTKIMPKVDEDENAEQMEALQTQNNELTEQLTAMQTQLTATETEREELTQTVANMLTETKALKSRIKSHLNVDLNEKQKENEGASTSRSFFKKD